MKEETLEGKATRYAIIIGIVVIALWLANWFIVPLMFCDPSEQGQFGDRFGATTSLFSGLTIVGLIVTIFLQRIDLKIARDSYNKQVEELALTREELTLSRKELTTQNRLINFQRRDNTFFNLINLHNQIVDGLPHKASEFIRHERNFIDAQLSGVIELERQKQIYTDLILSHVTNIFGQYLSNFEFIVQDILKHRKNIEIREKYLRIYFAQLSTKEKIFLLYHYNLTELPQYWNTIKGLLFETIQSNHLSYPPQARILDGISNPLDDYLNEKE